MAKNQSNSCNFFQPGRLFNVQGFRSLSDAYLL